MNYFVHSQLVNASFTYELIGAFCIVFLTEHKVFDILSVPADTHRTRSAPLCRSPVADQLYTRCLDFLKQSVDTYTF